MVEFWTIVFPFETFWTHLHAFIYKSQKSDFLLDLKANGDNLPKYLRLSTWLVQHLTENFSFIFFMRSLKEP